MSRFYLLVSTGQEGWFSCLKTYLILLTYNKKLWVRVKKDAKATENQKRYKRVGHLSQGRFKGEALEQNKYLLALART